MASETDRIAVLSDLHLNPDNRKGLVKDLTESLEEISGSDPDLLVVLGDIIQETDPETDEMILRSFCEKLDEMRFPYRCIPGNHDVVELDVSTFESVVGDSRWGIDQSSGHCFLDSSAPELSCGRGEIDEKQMTALEKELPDIGSSVVFVHHPIHYHDIQKNRWFGETPETAFCGNKKMVNDLLTEGSVDAVVNSHLHERDITRYEGVLHFTVDSFNKLKRPERSNGAYAILERGDRMRWKHVDGDGTIHETIYPKY